MFSATTGLTVNVAPNGEVTVTFGGPFGGGGANTFVAPFGGSPADLPAVLRAVVEGQHAAEQQYYLVLSVLAVAILALASVLIGWFVAGRLLRPLRTMTHAAREISSSNLGLRIAPTGPDDELKDLGETFDDLLGRLERSFEAQRQFVANASHELRTPLARQRALVQYALDDPAADDGRWRATFERVLVAEEQQERLFEALFTLARGERGWNAACRLTSPSRRRRAAIAGPGHRGRGAAPRGPLGRAVVRGDPQLLERLAANLVENAARYNVPSGEIEVTTETRLGRPSCGSPTPAPRSLPDRRRTAVRAVPPTAAGPNDARGGLGTRPLHREGHRERPRRVSACRREGGRRTRSRG